MLRVERAVSYAPIVHYDPLDANTAHLVLYADSEPARREELADAFGEVVEGLKEFDGSEIEIAHEEIHERWVGSLALPQAQLGLVEVNRAAVDWLNGLDFKPLGLLDAEAKSVTAGDLVDFSGDVQRSVMFAMPGMLPIRPWIGESVEASSVPLVEGRRIRALDAPVQREVLIHGPDGVSVLWPNGWYTTVRYSGLAAAVCYEDGYVRLMGHDAAMVIVEPTLWRDGENVCREIRESVPEHLLLNHGARSIGTIPRPTANAWQRLRSWVFWRRPMSRLPHTPCHSCGKAVRQGSAFCHHCDAVGPSTSIRKGRRYLSGILMVLGIQLVVAALVMVFNALLGGLENEDVFSLVIRIGFFFLGALTFGGSERSYITLGMVLSFPLLGFLALIWTTSSMASLGLSLMFALPIAIMDALAIGLYRSQSIIDFVQSQR
jgi:predicted nucleic acid-binding Zn ribbon protein